MDTKRVDEGCSGGAKRKAEEAFSDYSDCESDLVLQSEDEDGDANWTDNSKVVAVTHSFKPITGFQIMKPNIKKMDNGNKQEAILNTKYQSDDLKLKFKHEWNSNEEGTGVKTDSYEIIEQPWRVCVLNKVLNDDSILRSVRQEFYELDWNRRRMDLYDFHQSLDLKYIESEHIKTLYNFLKTDLMNWVADTMNLNLKSISATCSFYADTDYLLVHDDQQEDRVVAFVLYFGDVVPWDPSWGGALQLFSHDENFQPKTPCRNIHPTHNQLVLFPVSSISYHQVDEVIKKNFCRYSINGWFHGTVQPNSVVPKYLPPTTGLFSENYLPSKVSEIELPAWISEEYLAQYHIEDIQEHIEESSEISLVDFFLEEKYVRVCEELESVGDKWKTVGPPNRLRYEILEEADFPVNLKELVTLFQSESMFRLMQGYTELELDGKDAGVKYEVQRWAPGCYSLLSDYDWEKNKELDVIAYFSCEHTVGGLTQYVTEGDEIQQALITLVPQNNTLNIVYRDTAKITCFVSKYTSKPFYALVCSYTENKT